MACGRKRYFVAFLAAIGIFNTYYSQFSMSITVVAMVQNKKQVLENGTVLASPSEFQWDSKMEGTILAAFFYGYTSTQLLSGWLSRKIGAKTVFGGGIAVSAILATLTPTLAKINVYFLMTARVLQGMFEGVTYPCVMVILANWAPPLERARLTSVVSSGMYVGTVAAMIFSAIIAETLGWECVFYSFGILGIVWFLFWWWIVTDSPAKDPKISKTELDYIQEQLREGGLEKTVKCPWIKILTSQAVWAVMIAHFCEDWGAYTISTQLPWFMKDVLDYDLGKTGLLAAAPYLLSFVMIQFYGYLADWLENRQYLTTLQIRKLFCCGGFIINIIFLLGATLFINEVAIILCFMLATGIGVMCWSGYGVNFLDIAPQYAGVIMGLSNTLGSVSGVLSPIATGFIVVSATKTEWQIVWWLSCVVFLVGAIIYSIFASAQLQPWAREYQQEN